MLPPDLDGIVDFERYIPSLKDWFRREWFELLASEPGRGPGLLMGCPIWGRDYIDRFFFFCLPSIVAPANLEALRENGARLVIYTPDENENVERFWLMKQALAHRGILAQIRTIPVEVMAQIEDKPLNKYWLLGTVQNLLVQMAGHYGMAFHSLHPDHLYAHEYFPNMFRIARDYDGIAQTGISADIEACLPELEQWRKDGALVIPDLELGDMGFRHLHKQTRYNVMNDVDITQELPNSHFQCWVARDRLMLFCCHMNAAYLSAQACAQAPIRLHNALDTELPAFMPQVVCVPEVEDGMTFIELSDDRKLCGDKRVPFAEFAYQCWNTVHYKSDWMSFYRTPIHVPIKEQAADFLPMEEIQRRQNLLVDGLMKVKDLVTEFAKKQREELAALKAKQKEEAAAAVAVAQAAD